MDNKFENHWKASSFSHQIFAVLLFLRDCFAIMYKIIVPDINYHLTINASTNYVTTIQCVSWWYWLIYQIRAKFLSLNWTAADDCSFHEILKHIHFLIKIEFFRTCAKIFTFYIFCKIKMKFSSKFKVKISKVMYWEKIYTSAVK